MSEEINFWKSRLEENVHPFDNPLNIHGWAEPWEMVPIEEWDDYYVAKEDNTTPTGPGHFRIEDHQSYAEYIRTMNDQISQEIKQAQEENTK